MKEVETMGHHHSHDHGHDHDHNYKGVALQRLGWSLGITLVAMFLEIAGGYISGSIALISDAGHMLTHAFAITVSMFGIIIARRPRCHHRTFGLLRAEVLAALINGLFLMLVAIWIVVESYGRFVQPREIITGQMLLVAIIGLIVNIVSIFLLRGNREGDLNVQSVFMHMIGDAASSVAIIFVAIVIRYTQWNWLDPAISVLIAILIGIWAVGLLRESARVLLEMAPKGRNVHQITRAMCKKFPAIIGTDNEHVWTITQELIVFSAHIKVDATQIDSAALSDWLHEVEHWLADEFDVAESTLQVEFPNGGDGSAKTEHEAKLLNKTGTE